MNRGLSSNIRWLRSANYVKNEWCVRRSMFSSEKKNFINGLNMSLQQQDWEKTTVHRVETHWLSYKEKF